MINRPDRTVLLAMIFVVLFAGSNAVAARFTLGELAPFWSAALRFSAAALIFWGFVLFRRSPLPRGRALLGAVLYGSLAFGVGYAFLYWGLQEIPAGLTQVILALVPLLTFFSAYLHRLEPFRWRGLFGALLAAAGIAWAFFDRPSQQLGFWPLLAIVAGAACFAESSVVIKLFPRNDSFVANAIGLTSGALALWVVSRLAGEAWQLPVRTVSWVSFAYLVLIGSVAVFYLFLFVLTHWTASASSYQFVLMPFVTVVVSAMLAGESVNSSLLLGGALVLLGVWIGAFSGKPVPRTEPVEQVEAAD